MHGIAYDETRYKTFYWIADFENGTTSAYTIYSDHYHHAAVFTGSGTYTV